MGLCQSKKNANGNDDYDRPDPRLKKIISKKASVWITWTNNSPTTQELHMDNIPTVSNYSSPLAGTVVTPHAAAQPMPISTETETKPFYFRNECMYPVRLDVFLDSGAQLEYILHPNKPLVLALPAVGVTSFEYTMGSACVREMYTAKSSNADMGRKAIVSPSANENDEFFVSRRVLGNIVSYRSATMTGAKSPVPSPEMCTQKSTPRARVKFESVMV